MFHVCRGAQLTSHRRSNMRISPKARIIAFATAICGLLICTGANASVWVNPAGGSWNAPANWNTAPIIPNAVDAVADFGALDITADTIITLDGNKTAGTLLFGDRAPSHNWII